MAAKKKKLNPNSPLDRILSHYANQHLARKTSGLEQLELLDFMVAASPHLRKPVHLSPVLPYFDAIEHSPQFFCFSAPPRHGKSLLTNHAVARLMLRKPGIRVAYGCYSLDLSRGFFSDEIKDILISNGIEINRAKNTKEEWELANGSSFKAIAPGSGFTGRGADLIVIDDPYKGRAQAESGDIRKSTWEWVRDVCLTRRSPRCSVVVTHCIAEDEPILMADGSWKPVQNVRPGDMVMSYVRETGQFEPRRVLGQKYSGEDLVYTVKTDRKVARTNGRHPYMRPDGSKVKAQELQPGDEVVVFNGTTGTESCDLDWAWFLGFFLGDGWVTSWPRKNRLPSGNVSNTRSWCVCVAKSEYPELNERVQECMEKFFGQRPKETTHGYFRLDSNGAGRLLQSAGVTGGAWNKRVPEWIYRLRPDLKVAFLRGYADADGTYCRRTADSWEVASVSRNLIEDVRLLAISAGVAVRQVRSSSQMVQAPHSAAPKLSTIFKVSFNFALAPSKTERIVSVDRGLVRRVYDLMIEDTELFVTGGFVHFNTRWHHEDVIGILERDHGRPFINMPAIDPETGEALWEEEWPKERLLTEVKPYLGEYGWSSLYMGNPIPRGGAVFHDPHFYSDSDFQALQADKKIVRYVIGIDCAYTQKTHSDYSVAVVLAIDTAGIAYVVDVRRRQCKSPEFAEILKELRSVYNYAPIYWYVGGQELEVAEFFRNSCGVPIKDVRAKEDKFVRAQAVAAAWNAGRVKIPSDTKPWMDAFINEILVFSGLDDPHDDQVDALAAAYISQSKPRVPRGMSDVPILPW